MTSLNVIIPYVHALKNLKKRYFLSPFLLLIYVVYGYQISDRVSPFFQYGDKGFMDYATLVLTFFIAYALLFLQILAYPHSSYFLQTSRLYQKVFKGTRGVLGSSFLNYFSIGKNIPDDIYVQDGRSGRKFRISQSYKSKSDRVSDARTNYMIFITIKFFVIDVMLRFAVHVFTFFLSPIIFLFAVPTLRKNDALENLEY